MSRETTVWICEFCNIYLNENRMLVDSHERNLHMLELHQKQVKEVMHLISASGKRPKKDPVVWAKIIATYSKPVVDTAVQLWEGTVLPFWSKDSGKDSDSK